MISAYAQSTGNQFPRMLSPRETNLIVGWAYGEAISSYTEHTRNQFHRRLSIRGTNFRVCSAWGEIPTQSPTFISNMLSIRGTNFIAGWAYGERISSQAEHTGNQFPRMLSLRGNPLNSNNSAKSNSIFEKLVLQPLGTLSVRRENEPLQNCGF